MPGKTLSLGTAVIALPVAHLCAAALWIWGWTSGFGSDVAMFADARDVFSLSVSDLMWVYLGGLVAPLVLIGTETKREKSEVEIDLHEDANADALKQRLAALKARVKRLRRRLRTMGVLSIGVGVISVLWTLDQSLRGEPLGIVLPFAIGIPVGLAVLSRLDIERFERTHVAIAAVVIGLAWNAMTTGVTSGQAARHATFEEAGRRSFHCEAGVVLRRLGDNFVVARSDNRKIVTDLECKPLMTAQPERPRARREFHWSPYPHIHYLRKNSRDHA